MARDVLALRRDRDVRFAKLLGTGSGETFAVRDATPRRWALVATWADGARPESAPTVRRWAAAADERWMAVLDPLSARGSWSRRQPFGDPTPRRHHGPVAALTRARLAPRKARAFRRAVPPIAADLRGGGGPLLALAVGEAPIGVQGTFSVWRDESALREFAYVRAAHRDVIRRTERERWYAEELFARFAIVAAAGTVDGRDPLATP